jgi:hypothetical protein
VIIGVDKYIQCVERTFWLHSASSRGYDERPQLNRQPIECRSITEIQDRSRVDKLRGDGRGGIKLGRKWKDD